MSKADPLKEERYTPSTYIALVKQVLGEIDLDPASCAEANKIVQAKKYYTKADDGLKQIWKGQVFLNPPYSNIDEWVDCLLGSFGACGVWEAILLANSSTETIWFQRAMSFPWVNIAVCFVKGRICFNSPNPEATINQPTRPSMFIYFGKYPKDFCQVFKKAGTIMEVAR